MGLMISETFLKPILASDCGIFGHQNWERGTIPLKNSFKGYGGGEGGPTHPVPMLHRRLII